MRAGHGIQVLRQSSVLRRLILRSWAIFSQEHEVALALVALSVRLAPCWSGDYGEELGRLVTELLARERRDLVRRLLNEGALPIGKAPARSSVLIWLLLDELMALRALQLVEFF